MKRIYLIIYLIIMIFHLYPENSNKCMILNIFTMSLGIMIN